MQLNEVNLEKDNLASQLLVLNSEKNSTQLALAEKLLKGIKLYYLNKSK